MKWLWEFLGGLAVGFVAVNLLTSKGFWLFLFHLVVGNKRAEMPEILPDKKELTIEPNQFQPAQPVQKDLSKLPREELAELLRESDVRVVKN
jgi:hypothetical protein